jgi:very-short-patch-repair endonuclease
VLPRDYTDQENIIASYLSEWGIRCETQAPFPPYTVDFYIPELSMVIEADGVYGHLGKRDRIRDRKLIETGDIQIVLHCKETTKGKIKEFLWRELNKLATPQG